MKFPCLITGDIHVTPRNLPLFRKWTDFVCEFLDKGTLVIIGDIFDSPDVVKWECLLEVFDFFSSIYCFDIVLMSGNHDQVFFERPHATIQVLSRHVSSIHTYPRRDTDNIWWVPALPERRFLDLTQNKDWSGQALFMHQVVHQLRLNEKVPAQSAITFDHLKNFDIVFNGHLHKPQVIDNIINVGSPWQHSFAEAGQQKFMWLWHGKDRVDPILSPIADRFIEGTFQEVLTKNLKDVNVKIILQPEDDVDKIMQALQEKQVASWVFKNLQVNTAAPIEVTTEQKAEDYVVQFSKHHKVDQDTEELGTSFLDT